MAALAPFTAATVGDAVMVVITRLQNWACLHDTSRYQLQVALVCLVQPDNAALSHAALACWIVSMYSL